MERWSWLMDASALNLYEECSIADRSARKTIPWRLQRFGCVRIQIHENQSLR